MPFQFKFVFFVIQLYVDTIPMTIKMFSIIVRIDKRPNIQTNTESVVVLHPHWLFGVAVCKSSVDAPWGSGVVRIDPLHFLDGCRTKRLNQALSVLSIFECLLCS